MTTPKADITLDVDLRNPGQFFACCGVLELCGRVWPESEGWFAGAVFQVAVHAETTEPPLAVITRRLVTASPLVEPAEDAEAFDDKSAPLVLSPFGIRLDWWLRPGGSTDPDLFKLWSGNQHPALIFRNLHGALASMPALDGRDLLRSRVPMTGRFGVDPGPAWDAIDIGFSPNDQSLAVLTAPAAEILAGIGLQGFRPGRGPRRAVMYTAWAEPSPLVVARAAAAAGRGGRRFHFTVVNRGKYKAFGFAEEIEEVER